MFVFSLAATIQSPKVYYRITVDSVSVQRRIIPLQSNRGWRYVPTRTRVVISEPIIVQPYFGILILPLIAKRTIIQRTSCEGTKFSVDVKLRLPSFYAFGIIHFRRCAEIIDNNAVCLIAYKLCCGS